MSQNPYIKPNNPYDQLNANMEKLKDKPEIVEFSKLCYESLYASREGKKLMNHLNEKFLMSALPRIGLDNYSHECIRFEALRSFVRMLNDHIESHKQRIRAEVNK